jgi:hypothetical protein
MPPDDAAAVEALRERILDLKMTILEVLETAFARRDAAMLWSRCLDEYTARLNASEIELLTRIDRSHGRVAFDLWGYRHTPKAGLIGGRISDLFLLIGHIEEELTVGYYAKLRGLFSLDITIGSTGTPRFSACNYLTCYQNNRYLIDSVCKIKDEFEPKFHDHWETFRQRIAEAISQEFADTMSITITNVRRRDMPDLRIALEAYSDSFIRGINSDKEKAKQIAEVITIEECGDVLIVCVGKYQFKFVSDDQKRAIRYMHACHQHGVLDIPQTGIMHHLDPDHPEHPQLRDKFRTHTAWKQLIVSGTTYGCYRLTIPRE